MDIPPVGYGHKNKNVLCNKLRELEVGEFAVFPLKKAGSLHSSAKHAGIKIVTRQMGSYESVRCYRIE